MQKISIITVNFNNRIGLENTIKSVLSQDFSCLEYLVIDGGSTDGSMEIIKKYQERISYWVSESDHGIYNAMNKAIQKATGEYLLFLNSGDYFCSSHVLSDVFATRQDVDLLVGRQKFVGGNGKAGVSPKLHVEEINMEYFLSSTLPHQATFIKRTLFSNCGLYDESYRVCADWVFWIQAVVKHHCTLKILPMSVSYMDNGGVSSNMDKCHQDMSRYLQVCLDDGTLTWNDILSVAQKGRTQDICSRSKLLMFANKILAWIGRKM